MPPETRINFTPSEKDNAVIDLIKKSNPVTAQRGVDAIRKALEIYWFIYGPNAGLSRKEMAEFTLELQKRIADKLDVDYGDLKHANSKSVEQSK